MFNKIRQIINSSQLGVNNLITKINFNYIRPNNPKKKNAFKDPFQYQ